MFSDSEILDKVSANENSGVEFKEVRITSNKMEPHPDGLSDEIAAFANQQGGLIIFGIEDQTKRILGVDDSASKKLIQSISNICHDVIKPALVDFFVDNIKIPDETGKEKDLIYLEIGRSLWLHESKNGYFYRNGDRKSKMTTEHIIRVGQSRSQARIIHFDEQFVPNTNKETLQKDLYQRFTKGINEVFDDGFNKGFTKADEVDLLFKRHLLTKENDNYRASVAGILMCSSQPDDFLYNSFIQAVYYNGISKDANYQIDAKDFKGTLDQQIIDAFKFVEKYNKVSAIKDIGRIDKAQYSMKAIFEALVNAVVHRDYSKHGSKIRLFMFADRLEINSPGALANTLTIDTLPYNQVTRNELLARLLSEVELDDHISGQTRRKHFLERRGEGVGIILRESEQLSSQKPIYEVFGEELRLTIFAAKSLQEKD